jgi:hypothetical protein
MTPAGLATRIAVPPVAGFVLVAAYVFVEALGFQPFARTDGDTVSEAAALGHAARALQLIAAGEDASARHQVRAGVVDREEHELTAIEAAILGRHAELVRLLQRSGARHSDSARSICYARMRLPEVLGDLGATGADAPHQESGVETTISTCSAGGGAR